MTRIISVLFLVLAFCSVATAQNLVATTVAPANACANLGNPPTVGTCWDCFQSLLGDCDKQNPEGNRRSACYTAANNFFTWCLGRVGGGGGGAVNPRPHAQSIIRGEGVSYVMEFAQDVDPKNIEVYVRDFEGEKVREQKVTSFAVKNEDGSMSIFFDDNNLGLEQTKTIGVVTVVRNAGTNAIESAYAEAYSIVNNVPLTHFGLMRAWELYANNSMSFDEFIAYLNKYLSN